MPHEEHNCYNPCVTCLLLLLLLLLSWLLLQVFVWDLKAAPGSAATVTQLKHHKEAAVAAGWSNNCAQLVTADKTGGIAFWNCT